MKISEYKNTALEFTVCARGELFSAESDGRKMLWCRFDENELELSVLYDKREEPLSLRAKAETGDKIKAVLLPHRIELYVNGELSDEEWSYGDHFLKNISGFKDNAGVTVCEYKPDTALPPAVLGTFKNAEGWRPGKGVFVGDCMPYYDAGRYHVLYLKDRHHHKSKWGAGAHQWEHISTEDFLNWQIHPMAVEITEDWEGSVCTGSWIKKEDKHYLFYTIRTVDGSPAPIRRSVSPDGFHFEKDPDFSFTLSDKYHGLSARDPKVVLGEDGLYHMFLTTSLAHTGIGCLAHLVSEDMDSWQELPEPLYTAPDADQPECPDYFRYGGRYYLILSHHGSGQYFFSDEPFEGWIKPENNRIQCESVPKAAIWNDKIIFSGFERMNGYAGTLTFMQAVQNEDGTLSFKKLAEA